MGRALLSSALNVLVLLTISSYLFVLVRSRVDRELMSLALAALDLWITSSSRFLW